MLKMTFLSAALVAFLPVLAQAASDCAAPSFGLAGLLSKSNKAELPPITLSAGMPIATGAWELKSGTYYEFEIIGDGSQELALAGSAFFRAIWIDEIVVNGLEIRPLGLDSIEFDEAGVMEIGFVAIRPGRYHLKIPGTTGETQRVEIIIR